jgi:uncharacterized protein (TIRG00374 family)
MQNKPRSTRRLLVQIAKFALAIAILSYLVVQVQREDGFTRLVEEDKKWPLLVLGLMCTFAAILLNMIRWHLLIRAVGIDIRLRDTLRFGSLGYALNFVSPGAIGGDLFKAIFLAHGRRGRRTEAVATVAADRLMGVMTILVLASIGILATGLIQRADPTLAVLCKAMLVSAVVGLSMVALLTFIPGLTGVWMADIAHRVPLVGSTIARLLGAIRAYRGQKRLVLAALGVSAVGNLLLITSIYLIASGLPVKRPTWSEHVVLVPMANLVGAIPATPAGLGTKELAVEELYKIMPSTEGRAEGDGTLVTLAHRVTELAVALIGLIYILSHRAEVREVYEEVEEMIEEDEKSP